MFVILTRVSTGKLVPYWAEKLVFEKFIIDLVWSVECSSSTLSCFTELVDNSEALSTSVNVINTLKHQLIPTKYYHNPCTVSQ